MLQSRSFAKAKNSSPWLLRVLCVLCGSTLLFGCNKNAKPEIVLYTSVDEPVATPIIKQFEKETGLSVRVQTDAEANRSVGLAEKLRAEAGSPQADVYWNNEFTHTVLLADEGVLAAYRSPSAADVPDRYKDAKNRWAAVGLRARVLGISTAAAGVEKVDSILRLADPAVKGKVIMANPVAGTTSAQVAAMYVLWGDAKADQFFRDLRANGVKLVGGNSLAAEQVGAGNFSLCLTDNDDVDNAAAAGGSIRAVLPDQGPGGIGTLTLPTTVSLVAGRPENAGAKKLVDYLLSARVEKMLLAAKYSAYSVRAAGGKSGGPAVKGMDVSYADVAHKMPDAVRRSLAILQGRE